MIGMSPRSSILCLVTENQSIRAQLRPQRTRGDFILKPSQNRVQGNQIREAPQNAVRMGVITIKATVS